MASSEVIVLIPSLSFLMIQIVAEWNDVLAFHSNIVREPIIRPAITKPVIPSQRPQESSGHCKNKKKKNVSAGVTKYC